MAMQPESSSLTMTHTTETRAPGVPIPLPRIVRRSLAAAALGLALVQATAAPLEDLRRQVEGSQFELAYKTAQANPQLIGDVHFDFLYGVAAINVGRVSEGLLALERHLSAVPANDRARLELARGYFLLGEYSRARAEFEFVLRYNPPAGVRSNIAGYLQAMQVREVADRRATGRFYAEAGIGHDSNVNGGTFRDELQLAFGPVSLAGSPSQQVADGYAQVAAGGQKLLRVSTRMSVFAGADLDHRANFKQRIYDLTNGSAYVGFTQLSGPALWRVTLGVNQMRVDQRRYRDMYTLSSEASRALGADWTLMGFGQYGEMRHSDADEVRDARSFALGAMLTRNFADLPWAPSAGVRMSFTRESNLRLREDLSRDMPLLRVFAGASPVERLRVTLGLTVYRQDFAAEDIGFGTKRVDKSVGADIVANLAIDANWSLRGEAVWLRTRSNQDLYDSERSAASVKLRYQF